MNFFNTIYTTLLKPNIYLSTLISFSSIFIEVLSSTLLFTTILNTNFNKKQKAIYIISTSIICSFSYFFLEFPVTNIINLTIIQVTFIFFFKLNILQSIVSQFIPINLILCLKMIIDKLFITTFNIDYKILYSTPILILIINFIIYFIIILFYTIIKYTELNITITTKLYNQNNFIVKTHILITLIIFCIQLYLILFCIDSLPLYIMFINILFLIAYSYISIINLINIVNLEEMQINLTQEKLCNKTLQALHDNIRAFKHDFANILAGIGGYIEINDMPGLKKYYNQLMNDCNHIKNYTSLSPEVINSPPVYALLANKYYTADNLNIKINLDSFINFNNLNMNIYEFTRILGILMDNAIEAASECRKKLINITIRTDNRHNCQLLIIENTYKDKNINIDKLSQKGYTSKPQNTGLGLWEIENIIKKHKNIAKFTSKNTNFFIQQIEIYKR